MFISAKGIEDSSGHFENSMGHVCTNAKQLTIIIVIIDLTYVSQ